MIIDCIADLHGFYPTLEGGDLLIIAGDITARDLPYQYMEFALWLDKQDYKRKILIAGNHDRIIYKWANIMGSMTHFKYLMDSETKFSGYKIWGSPWTPTFQEWHFMKDRGAAIKEKWDLIPDDTEILITHGPPFGIQDQADVPEKFLGCEELRNALDRLKNLKLHVFGHIHEGYGKVIVNGVTHVNASIVNEHYKHVNKPIRVVLSNDARKLGRLRPK